MKPMRLTSLAFRDYPSTAAVNPAAGIGVPDHDGAQAALRLFLCELFGCIFVLAAGQGLLRERRFLRAGTPTLFGCLLSNDWRHLWRRYIDFTKGTVMSQYHICKAALILNSIRHVAEIADEDCGDTAASSQWLIIIEAAATQANYLLTGYNLDEPLVKKAARGKLAC